jgi:hypothetical protein
MNTCKTEGIQMCSVDCTDIDILVLILNADTYDVTIEESWVKGKQNTHIFCNFL